MSTHARPLVATIALALGAVACTYVRPALQPGPWDMAGDSGALKVHGAPRTDAGPRIFRALRREPTLAKFLEEQGEPDTVEVVGARLRRKHIVLTYRRDDAPPPRRIVLDPSSHGYVARAPEVLRSERVVRHEQPPQEQAKVAPCTNCDTANGTPTAMQRLECPIDRRRSECRAFCVPGASYEWCR